MPITFIPEPHLLDSPRGRPFPGRPRRPGALMAGPVRLPPATTQVAIVGAGPAGLAVASALWHLGVHDVVLLDRDGRPCGRFFDRIDTLGQRVMRSPYDHHPGLEGYRDCELLDFARLHWDLLTPVERREIRMAQAGHRSVVPVDLFEAFCRHVATIHQVPGRTWKATVREIRPSGDAVIVRTGESTITAAFAVLCTGERRRPAPESWWAGGPPPRDVTYWDEPIPYGAGRLIVIGAGLSAAHLIAGALAEGRQVHWVLRAAGERYQCADVNSRYFRAEGRAHFTTAWRDRLAVMRAQRRASVMYEFRPLLRGAEDDGRLTVHRGRDVVKVASKQGGGVAVDLAGGSRIDGDHVALALGTDLALTDQLLPAELVAARDGWPDLDEPTLAYRRAPRVFVVGTATGMVLGPAARNIDGHRVATARVTTAIRRASDG